MKSLAVVSCLTLILIISLPIGKDRSAHAQQAATTSVDQSLSQALLSNRHPYLHNGDFSAERAVLQPLYQQRNFSPLWLAQNRPTQQALDMLTLLRNAASYGLRATDYDGIRLTYQLTALISSATEAQIAPTGAQLELGLSIAALRFIKHLHYGRIDPRTVGFDLKTSRDQELNLGDALNHLSSSRNVAADITKFEPQFSHYQLLKNALARYRLLAVDDQLTQLPSFTGRSIKAGEVYTGAAALRRLLVAEQDLPSNAMVADTDLTLDAALVKALQTYQTRHGLQADGALGKQTFAALTMPFSRRVQQIELTLERWRWLPPLQSPMIVVNIPQFKLFAFKSADDREANLLRMDVIVGQAFAHTQTPVFLGEMKYVVFRPYWDIPRNIVQREMLPTITKDPGYLQRNQLELVNGQGDNSPLVSATPENLALLASGKLRLRQRPGDSNALGEVKFMLPNSYNVYLHSTPARQLFNESRRAFSHGCIRVSDPTALAEYVLRNAETEWSQEKIQLAMQGKPNQRVTLMHSIPVLIVYGTAIPLESGVVQFFDDIYGHDSQLAKLL
jgi:murein L,D-transpeptidase YcbB/YkuD